MLTHIQIEDTVYLDGWASDPERHEETLGGCFAGAPVNYSNRYTPERQFAAEGGERFGLTEWPEMANAVIDALHLFGQQAHPAIAAIIKSGRYHVDHLRVTVDLTLDVGRKQIKVDLRAEEYIDGNFRYHYADQVFDMEGKLVSAERAVPKSQAYYQKIFGLKQDKHVAQIARAFLMAMDVFEGA